MHLQRGISDYVARYETGCGCRRARPRNTGASTDGLATLFDTRHIKFNGTQKYVYMTATSGACAVGNGTVHINALIITSKSKLIFRI